MTNLITNYVRQPFASISMQTALSTIKHDIEQAIVNRGAPGQAALIKSQRPIKLIHDVIKTDFLKAGVHVSLINPGITALQINARGSRGRRRYVLRDRELSLAGYFKYKKQDVTIVPANVLAANQSLILPTYMSKFPDTVGHDLTESIIAVNVRSQLSSTDKNFDTLYERTIAESYNLHNRCEKMVLGEVYLISAREYDNNAAKNKTVAFINSNHVEKYIKAFQALNNRTNISDPNYKYERVALLVVDFSLPIPKLYSSTADLVADGIISSSSNLVIEPLAYGSFIGDLMQIHSARFPAIRFN